MCPEAGLGYISTLLLTLILNDEVKLEIQIIVSKNHPEIVSVSLRS